MVRKLHIRAPLDCLATILSTSAEFATFIGLGSVDETAQLAAVHYGYTRVLTPKAVIATVDLETAKTSTTNFDTTIQILLRLERQTPTSQINTTESDQYKTFLTDCEGVLDDIREATADLGTLNIQTVNFANPPQIIDDEDNTTTDLHTWRFEMILGVIA